MKGTRTGIDCRSFKEANGVVARFVNSTFIMEDCTDARLSQEDR